MINRRRTIINEWQQRETAGSGLMDRWRAFEMLELSLQAVWHKAVLYTYKRAGIGTSNL